MSEAAAFAAARAAVIANSVQAADLMRAYAIASGTSRPEASSVRAIRAVIERMAGIHSRDKDAWEANGASKTNFKQWKGRISRAAVDYLDAADLESLGQALGESSQVVHPPVARETSDECVDATSLPPSAPNSSSTTFTSDEAHGAAAGNVGRACCCVLINSDSSTARSHRHCSAPSTERRLSSSHGVVTINKPARDTRVGIRLVGTHALPKIGHVHAGTIAADAAGAASASSDRPLLSEGAHLIKVNGTTVLGHQHGTQLLKEAVGAVALEISLEPMYGDRGHEDAELTTSDITLISHTHGRERRAERGIERRDLQAAIKHGRREPAHRSPRGEPRWRYTYNGVVYVTDATSRQEVTSWRDDGKDMALEPPPSCGEYGVHVVMIVDSSGSMRTADVDGYTSRTAAVYDCLRRDLVEPQLSHGFLGAGGRVVASLIEMSDEATVCMERAPYDSALLERLQRLGGGRARSHGNCTPQLE